MARSFTCERDRRKTSRTRKGDMWTVIRRTEYKPLFFIAIITLLIIWSIIS